MSLLAVFIGELPLRIGTENVFVNAWSYEHVFGVGEDGVAYRDNNKNVRVNPRLMLEDFDAVVARVTALGANKWTPPQVRGALEPVLQNLLAHFEVDRQHLGTVVRVSKKERTRLKNHPNINREVRIPREGLEDLEAQNGKEAAEGARNSIVRKAMGELANAISGVLD